MKRAISVFWWILASAAAVSAQTAVIRSGSLKVYEAPQANARLISTLSDGDTVKVILQRGVWAKLQLPGKRTGWMQLSESTSAALFKKPRKPQTPATTAVPESQQRRLETSPGDAPADEAELRAGAGIPGINNDLNLGIAFTLGALGESFAYSGRFLYRTLPKIYIEGAFQHVPGDVAASMLVHSNLLYSFSLAPRWDGWLTGGVGVISTSPTKTVGAKSVSNMEVNYGIGVRRYLKQRTYLRADLRQFSVLVDSGTKTYVEFALGLIIGIR